MSETSRTLLDQLRTDPDSEAWQRLVGVYTPMIRNWLRQHAALQADLDDLVQEVLIVVVRKLPLFDRQRSGAFRRWLRFITVNCLREYWRGRAGRPVSTGDSAFLHTLDQLEDPNSDLSQLWDREHDQHVTRFLLQQIQPRFEPATWLAFEKVALDGQAPAQVAQELGITVNAVFIAKSRVLTLLRQEGQGLLD